eukprot:2172993-Rhodomonas_salina.1
MKSLHGRSTPSTTSSGTATGTTARAEPEQPGPERIRSDADTGTDCTEIQPSRRVGSDAEPRSRSSEEAAGSGETSDDRSPTTAHPEHRRPTPAHPAPPRVLVDPIVQRSGAALRRLVVADLLLDLGQHLFPVRATLAVTTPDSASQPAAG